MQYMEVASTHDLFRAPPRTRARGFSFQAAKWWAAGAGI